MGTFDTREDFNNTATFGQPQRLASARPAAPFRATAAAPAAPDTTRGEGLLTKYRPIGGWQDQGRGANLVANAGEMGEPTSFHGGAGAPAPVEVVRGMRMTYTNPAADTGGGYAPTPGRGTAEFATPTEAGQAFNRGQRGAFLANPPANPNLTYPPGYWEKQADEKYGEYQPVGTNLLQQKIEGAKEATSAENKAPEKVEQAKHWTAKTAAEEAANRKTQITTDQGALRQQLEQEIGSPDATGKNLSLPTDPQFQAIHKKMDGLIAQGVPRDEAYKAVAPELHKLYSTPENINGAINLYQKQTGKAVPPETIMALQSGKPQAMETLYPWIQEYRRQPKPGFFGSMFQSKPYAAPGGSLVSSIPAEADVFGAGGAKPTSPQEQAAWQAQQAQKKAEQEKQMISRANVAP